MASVLGRNGILMALGVRTSMVGQPSSLISRVLRPATQCQTAGIAHKDHLDPEVLANKPPAWPYERKRYGYWHDFFNVDGWFGTTGRFDENSKIITVEGNVGSGKSVFAQNLADQLGMRYFPELNLDTAYVTEEGFDYRSFNEHLPLQARFPDLPDVFEYRHPTQAAALQHILYRMRFMNYVNALTHLYQTGQGCVVERSPWSDSVFADHLKNENFYSSSFGNFYWMMRSQTISFLQRPHLVIYIDVDADKCLETIQKRNTNFEVKHVNKRFLQGIETLYKEKMLPRIEKHAELMILQMNQSINEKNVEDNVLLAISDIENLDFEQYFKTERDTEKMDDWKYLCSEGAWNQMRRYYSNERDDLLSRFYLPDYDVKELQVPPELMVLRDHIMNIYGIKYSSGQNEGFFKTMFAKKPSIEMQNKANWFFSTC